MPAYYDFGQRAVTTNGTGNTETAQVMFLSQANKPTASFTGVFANCVGSVAGGGVLTGSTFATAGAVGTGTAQTPNKKNPNNTASGLLCTTGTFTAGTGTRSVRLTAGFAQTGGQAGWIAVTPDTAVQLLANGGTNGYLEFASLANAASQTFNYETEWTEN